MKAQQENHTVLSSPHFPDEKTEQRRVKHQGHIISAQPGAHEAGHTAVWLQNPQSKHQPQPLHKATRGCSSQHLHEDVWDVPPSDKGCKLVMV